MARCVSSDQEVPASTEIVIEGIMPAGGCVEEGPMAEYTGHGHGG
jgi:UbiD family decarboxylase